jgi:hypothetical protein
MLSGSAVTRRETATVVQVLTAADRLQVADYPGDEDAGRMLISPLRTSADNG